MTGPPVPDPAKAEPGSMIEPPCGCLMWVQDEAFMVRPCSLGCPLYAYARAAAAKLGKPFAPWFGEDP